MSGPKCIYEGCRWACEPDATLCRLHFVIELCFCLLLAVGSAYFFKWLLRAFDQGMSRGFN